MLPTCPSARPELSLVRTLATFLASPPPGGPVPHAVCCGGGRPADLGKLPHLQQAQLGRRARGRVHREAAGTEVARGRAAAHGRVTRVSEAAVAANAAALARRCAMPPARRCGADPCMPAVAGCRPLLRSHACARACARVPLAGLAGPRWCVCSLLTSARACLLLSVFPSGLGRARTACAGVLTPVIAGFVGWHRYILRGQQCKHCVKFHKWQLASQSPRTNAGLPAPPEARTHSGNATLSAVQDHACIDAPRFAASETTCVYPLVFTCKASQASKHCACDV